MSERGDAQIKFFVRSVGEIPGALVAALQRLLPIDSASFPESQLSELGGLTTSLRYMR